MMHRDEIAGFAPVPGHTWTVGVAESRDFFPAPLERLFEKVVASVLLVGCEETQPESADEPAQVVPIKGSDVPKVVLTAEAAHRIGLKTATVEPSETGTAVPLAAVVYDRDGSTWVYTVEAPLTYVRERVTLGDVDGDVALLEDGPPAGTEVVTVGAAELLGSEYGVEGE